jgi:hypothetical protein
MRRPGLLRAELAQLGAIVVATALAAGTYRDGFAVLRRIVTPANRLFEP